MRIISGIKKGLALKSVSGQSTRPTADKVKESIFNMIGPYFQGGTILDLYAGSGAIGIEALSRGMDKAVFVDKERAAVKTIFANLEIAKFADSSEVFRTDANSALKAIRRKQRSFDLIFLDPPYEKEQIEKELLFIQENMILNKGGCIVVEHTSRLRFSDEFLVYEKTREENYGDTGVTIFQLFE